MAEGPLGLVEQRFARRVVQVDVVRVGEDELDQAKRVVRARILAQGVGQALAQVLAPGDGGRVDFLAAGGEHAQFLFGQVAFLGEDARHGFVLEDVRRDGPGRVEHQVGDGRAEHRGLVERFADHHPGFPGQPVLVVVLQVEAGDIDDNARFGHVVHHPPGPLQVDADLADAAGDRDVHGRHGGLAGDPVRFEMVAHLKGANRRLHRSVEQIRVRGVVTGQFTGDRQPRAQGPDAVVPHARLQAAADRHRLPAAAAGDFPVPAERFLQAGVGRVGGLQFVQGLAHGGGAQGGEEGVDERGPGDG